MSDWFERFGWDEVATGLAIGAYPLDAGDVRRLREAGIEVVYNLCEEVEYAAGERLAVRDALAAEDIAERRLAFTDYGALPPRALGQAVEEVAGELSAGRRVYVHCRAGWQRSAAIAAGVVAVREGIDVEQALALVRERKPTAEPLAHQRADLLAWWRTR